MVDRAWLIFWSFIALAVIGPTIVLLASLVGR